MPDFIALLRDIRDRMYIEMKGWYTNLSTLSVGTVTNIEPALGITQQATVSYDETTSELSFGIPVGQKIESVTAVNIPAVDGVVQPATAVYTQSTGNLALGIPLSAVIDNTDASLLRADGSIDMNTGYTPLNPLSLSTMEYANSETWVNKFAGSVTSIADFYTTYGSGKFLILVGGHSVVVDVDQSTLAYGYEKIVHTENDLTFMVKIFIATNGTMYSRNYNVSTGTFTDQNITSVSRWERT